MKGKYITSQILLACLSKPPVTKKDVHEQLALTLAERKIILLQWQVSFFGDGKDIHAQLAETIAERRKVLREWERSFFPKQETSYTMQDKQAA
jgi:hypothetical protein